MPDDGGVRTGKQVGFDPDVARAALFGLGARVKTLPARLFYDEAGCRLFDEITRLPEYYPTRTELSLLPAIGADVFETTTAGTALIEYGASDETKASFLLRGGNFSAYVPIDVAQPALDRLQARMAVTWPSLRVAPVAADFLQPIVLPAYIDEQPRLGFFPGSTIGNLDPIQARSFLTGVRGTLGRQARFLIGIDLRKHRDILLPAYDDAAGVTAAFNRNLLIRLNREADANFIVGDFQHEARWNNAKSRIEMHLVSTRAQYVRVAGHVVRFAAGESIHTENSYKFTVPGFSAMAAAAGWRLARSWTDPAGLFSVVLLEQATG